MLQLKLNMEVRGEKLKINNSTFPQVENKVSNFLFKNNFKGLCLSQKNNLAINNQKKLPSNLEAEQALIGSILINNEILDEVSNLINSDKFFDPGHKKIFKIIESLNFRGMIANPITIKNFIDNDKRKKMMLVVQNI